MSVPVLIEAVEVEGLGGDGVVAAALRASHSPGFAQIKVLWQSFDLIGGISALADILAAGGQ